VVVCHVGDDFGATGPPAADLVVGPADVDHLVERVRTAPIAASALAVLLRAAPAIDVERALASESAVYSLLQAGPEFAAWRESTPRKSVVDDRPTVRTIRDRDTLEIRLDRPHRHNAITARLRDELHAELSRAVDDPGLTVVLSGEGPSFCSGGDLAEFGDRPDPATAHIVRMLRSPARRIHQLCDRIEARIHGSTLGGGIEMVSFAGRVVAAPDVRIALPEVGLGLIPGAGGTVGIPRRIGRQRTAALAITGRVIDATTAAGWGLVDEITGTSPSAQSRR
jgi:enoyl-CoA hydratase/carnithine racemase